MLSFSTSPPPRECPVRFGIVQIPETDEARILLRLQRRLDVLQLAVITHPLRRQAGRAGKGIEHRRIIVKTGKREQNAALTKIDNRRFTPGLNFRIDRLRRERIGISNLYLPHRRAGFYAFRGLDGNSHLIAPFARWGHHIRRDCHSASQYNGNNNQRRFHEFL